MDVKKEFTVFYSWQSDLPKNVNNYFILNCIRKATKLLKKDGEINVDPRVDKDTLDTPGSPDIIEVIFKKISVSNIFICDITPVYKYKARNNPNANVLIELGYAVKSIGWSRIICICNIEYGEVDNLPFNIRKNRISVYSLRSALDKTKAQMNLTGLLVEAMKKIITQYDKIINEAAIDDIYSHDLKIFEGLRNIFTSDELLNLIEYIGSYFTLTTPVRKRLNQFREYLYSAENSFLSAEINKKSELLLKALNMFMYQLGIGLFVEKMEKITSPNTKESVDLEFTYSIAPYEGGWSYEEYEKEQTIRKKRIVDASFELDKAYKNFRLSVKKNLFI